MGRKKKSKTNFRPADNVQTGWHCSPRPHVLCVRRQGGEKLPNYITNRHLEQHFADFLEEIEKIKVMRNFQTMQSLGYAKMNVSTRKSADRIIAAMSGTKLCEKIPLSIEYEQEEHLKKPVEVLPDSSVHSSSPDSSSPTLSEIQRLTAVPFEMYISAKKSLFPDCVTAEDLREHFSEFVSEISEAVIIYDQTQKSKGYGFITFSCEDAARRAMAKKRESKLMGQYPIFMKIRKCEGGATPSSSKTVHKRTFASVAQKGQHNPTPTRTSKSSTESQLSQASSGTTRVQGDRNQRMAKPVTKKDLKQTSCTSKQPSTEKCCEVFVGGNKHNIPAHVSYENLRNHFASFNQDIVRIKRIKEKERFGGFDFMITLTSENAAKLAVKDMDGTVLNGKFTLIVAHGRSFQQQSDPPGIPLPEPFSQAVETLPRDEGNHHIISPPNPAPLELEVESDWPMDFPSDYEHSTEDQHDNILLDPYSFQSEPIWRDVLDSEEGLLTSHYMSAMEFPSHCTVLVGTPETTFPRSITEKQLTQHFGKFESHIIDVKIIRSSSDPRPSGASITFATIQAARHVMEQLNRSKLLGLVPLILELDPTTVCQSDPQAKLFTERLKLNALVDLYPNLVTSILQKFIVELNGYWSDSIAIILTGLPGAVQQAKEAVISILLTFIAKEVQFTHPHLLVESARQKCQADNILVYLQFNERSKILYVCAFSDVCLSSALELLQKTPFEKALAVPSGMDLDPIESQLKSHEEKYFVMTTTETTTNDETAIKLCGFDWERILVVYDELEKLFKATMTKTFTLPLECTQLQALFLKNLFFDQPTSESDSLLQSLPARVIKASSNEVILIGTQKVIKTASDLILSSRLITQLVSKTWYFKCSINFQKLIEEHVFRPMRSAYLDVTCIFDKTSSTSAEDGTAYTFSIHIFSLKSEDLEKASERMKDLDPQTQCFPLPESELIPTAMECFKATEKRHCTEISHQYKPRPAVIVHGLCSNDIAASWKKIEEHVGVNYIATEIISLSAWQLKYLQAKHGSVLEAIRTTCVVELPPIKANQELLKQQRLKMAIKGSYSAVKEAAERINGICSNLFTDSVQLSCKVEHVKIWQKRWDMLQREQERESGTFIEYTCTPEAKGRVLSSFVIYGACKKGIASAKQALLQVENGKTLIAIYFSVTDAELATLKKAIEQNKIESLKKFNIILQLQEKQKKIEIQAPEPSKRELELAKGEILRYLDEHTEITKEKRFMDSSLGHMITSDSLMHYHGIVKMAEKHYVNVSPLKTPYYALKLKGMQCGVRKMEEVIEVTQKKLLKQLDNEQLVIEANYSSVLSSEDFVQFSSQLTEELSVICSFPTPHQKTKTVREVHLKSPTGHILTVQICKGNIISEKVDAIVNAANEDLSHCGGIALAISEAGGPSIQTESTEYVRKHGKVMPGTAVCLGGGELPCSGIVHAVGPRWRGGKEGELECLKKAISKSLLFGHYKSFGSISVPAIGTGIFQVPTEVFAEALFTAIEEFREMFDKPTLHTIRIVLDSEDKIKVVKNWFDRIGEPTTDEDSDGSAISTQHSESEASTCRDEATSSSVQAKKHVQPQLQWSWYDGRRFQNYLPQENDILNQNYSADPNSNCTLWINNTQYQVDFQIMKQKNLQTGYIRNIKCESQHVAKEGTTAKQSFQWHFMDNSFKYVPYAHIDSYKIEQMYQAYQKSKRRSVTPVRIQGHHCVFDFKCLLQSDVRTSKRRPIKRTTIVSERSNEPVQWYYKNEKRIFVPYTEDISDEIEEMYMERTLVVTIPIKSRMCVIDFEAMREIDLQTQHKREIKRQKKGQHKNLSSEEEVKPLTEIVLNIRGPKENLDSAREKILSKLESLLTNESLTLPQGFSKASTEMLEEVAKEYGVSINTDTDNEPNADDESQEVVVTLTGPKLAVIEARGVVLEQVMRLQTTEHANALAASHATAKGVEYPAEWQSQSKTTQLFDLREGTSEWTKVAGRFSETMTGYTITSIKRIQNKYLWQRYEQHKKMMDEKNDGRINEMELFHGTRSNRPEKIYDSEEGFDMRHSADGLWGQANYFAQNANYSNKYRYRRPDGQCEMFLARILTGDSYCCESNGSLRMPPVKEGYQASNVQLGEVRYDTVNGTANGTKVYMTYSNEKAYPAYLIQYSETRRSGVYGFRSGLSTASHSASAGYRSVSQYLF